MKAYSQRDPRWGNQRINNTSSKMSDFGCFVTSLSMLASRNPIETLSLLENGRCFNGDLIISWKAANSLQLQFDFSESNPLGKTYDKPDYDCIVEVDFSPASGKQQHFCVSLASGGIIDPWDGNIKPDNSYKVVSYRMFKNIKESPQIEKLDAIIANQKKIYEYLEAWKNLDKDKILKNLSRVQKLAHESADLARELK